MNDTVKAKSCNVSKTFLYILYVFLYFPWILLSHSERPLGTPFYALNVSNKYDKYEPKNPCSGIKRTMARNWFS